MRAEDEGVPCMLMRGGTSKGAFFLPEDLPSDPALRDDLLLRIMGSPDPTQIDGLGGAHPLTSKVAIVSCSEDPSADLDYLFLQVAVDEPFVGDAQTCGNLLAAVVPFAVERGLIPATAPATEAVVRLINTGDRARVRLSTRDGVLDYDGDVDIDGVPGTACPIELEVSAGPGKGLLPTSRVTDQVADHTATLIDNGMPVVLLDAADFGVTGTESIEELEARPGLAAELERIRLAAGPLLGLGDVAAQTVPKLVLVAPPADHGAISVRAFIPARLHPSIGVLMAASVAAGIRIPGAVGSAYARLPETGPTLLEHPSGSFPAEVRVTRDADGHWRAASLSLRTARKIFDGRVFPRPRR
ncbi:PrpF domain-containing protein [Microbacterium sp. 22242]|uniref:PrpF domain-containing protein n=1 Tax=Microbacterium sp. 22242 TaxID=3453896 RepID=UPI003F86E480